MNGGRPPGLVYLIHFDQPIGNPDEPKGRAQHYTGHAGDLDARTGDHHGANAAKIMQAVNAQGITWRVVRTWEGTRDTERAIKNLNAGPRLCPVGTEYPLSAAGAIARAEEVRQAHEAAREAARPLPRNRDGSISRSRTSDAQKAAAGLMTSAQQAEHTALRRGLVTGKPAHPAERGALDIDPWAIRAPRTAPGREIELEAG
jgi:hypothetical protein